jgi:hypothetical protein
MGVSGQHHAPAALYPRGKDPGTHCTGGWVGPKAGLDAGARRKILCLCRGLNPDRPARSQTLYCLRYRGSFNSVYVMVISVQVAEPIDVTCSMRDIFFARFSQVM